MLFPKPVYLPLVRFCPLSPHHPAQEHKMRSGLRCDCKWANILAFTKPRRKIKSTQKQTKLRRRCCDFIRDSKLKPFSSPLECKWQCLQRGTVTSVYCCWKGLVGEQLIQFQRPSSHETLAKRGAILPFGVTLGRRKEISFLIRNPLSKLNRRPSRIVRESRLHGKWDILLTAIPSCKYEMRSC